MDVLRAFHEHPSRRDRGPWRIPALLAVMVFLWSRAAASSESVQVWQQTWAGKAGAASLSGTTPAVARELADGSTMIVGPPALRYDHDGNLLSSVPFSAPYLSYYTSPPPNGSQASVVAIDPFGGIFVASASNYSRSNSNTGDLWLMKYDGLTGKTQWPAPRIYDGGQGDIPVRLLVDSQGNAVLVGQSRVGGTFKIVVFKYEGVSGALLWGPTAFTGYGASTAALDPSGNILVASPGSLFKIDGQTGAPVWGPVSSGDNLAAIAVDSNGDVAVAGYGSNFIEVARYSGANGSRLWGPSVYTETVSPALRATGIEITPSGDFVLTGLGGNQFYLLKYSGGGGGLLWGPRKSSASGLNGGLTVRIAGNGDVVAAGTDSANQVSISRYSGATGALLWGPLTDGGSSGDQYSRATALICSNGRILSATVHYTGSTSSLTTIERDPVTGAAVWSAPFQQAADLPSRVTDMTQGPDGSVFVTGYTHWGNDTFVTFKYDRATGAVLWGPVLYELSLYGYPYMVRTDSAGDVFVMGQSQWTVLLKYSGATGALLWGPVTLDSVTPGRMAVDPSGSLLVVGTADTTLYQTNSDLVTLKVSGATGQVLWGPVLHDGGPGWNDYAYGIAATAGGDAVVIGAAWGLYQGQWEIIKYSGATGAVLWGPSILTQPDYGGEPWDLAVDSSGDIAVAGWLWNGADTDMTTIKYSGSTGSALWGPKALAGSGNWDDTAEAVAIDSAGDVLVTGYLNTLHGAASVTPDVATAKYRGSDGALLWGPQLYDGPNSDSEGAYAIGLDSGGNPVVAGETRNAAHNWDIVILKYDGATGAPLWEPILQGGFGEDDLPFHNLVVRGKSAVIAGTISNSRFLTVAYDEVFGIRTVQEEFLPAYCGRTYSKTLIAGNAAGSVAWSVVSGALPAGLTLNSSTGEISGTPAVEGAFAFRVKAQDSLQSTFRDFVLDVFGGSGFVPILSTSNPVCPGQNATLSVAGSWTSYHWLPGGETSATILVSPDETTEYGVILENAAGCRARGVLRVSVGSQAATTASNNGPICAGQTLQLSASTVPGAVYSWVGPGGFTSAEQNPQILSAPASASGLYSVTTSVSGCLSPAATTSVTVRALPSAAISATSSICPQASSQASVPSSGPGATYSWTITNGSITAGQGTNSVTFTAGSSGTAHLGVTVTDASGCSAVGNKSVAILPGCATAGFYTVEPCRILDTRSSPGPLGGPALSGETSRTFAIAGSCGIPPTARAVAVNIAETDAEGSGHLRIYPAGSALPNVAAINFVSGQTRSNNAILLLGPNGDIAVFAGIGTGLHVDFILDVVGYFE